MEQTRAKELAITAAKIRLAGLEAVHTAASGHIGGSLSVTDVLTVLYFDKMHIDPQNCLLYTSDVYKRQANIAFAGFTAPKILWMKKHEPENFSRISKIMLPKDYLAYRISGSFCTDVSDASGMLLLDVKNRRWSAPMLGICEITERMLPRVYESYEVVGTLKKTLAAELGLSSQVKVIAGAGDNAAAAVGTGTVGDGMCNLSLGTSGTLFVSSKNFGVDQNNALHSFGHADGHYRLMGCMLSAASCNKWWSEEIPVSYTHLDVYKRQIGRKPAEGAACQMDALRSRNYDLGRADPRNRRRRQI